MRGAWGIQLVNREQIETRRRTVEKSGMEQVSLVPFPSVCSPLCVCASVRLV